MNERSDTAVPVTFWIVGVVALVWNLLGVGSFFGEMSSGGLAEMAVWGAAAFLIWYARASKQKGWIS